MAKVDWVKKLGWDFNHLEDIIFVGYHYIRQGRYQIAQAFFEGLVAMNADQPLAQQLAYDYETLGALYLQLGDYARSLRYLERAHRMQPENGRVLLNKVKALVALKRVMEGLALAHALTNSKDPILRDRAQAIILSQELVGIKLDQKSASSEPGAIVNLERVIANAFEVS